VRKVRLAADPENVASLVTGPAVVVSATGRAVTLLGWRSLRVLGVLRGFVKPHLAAISRDGEYAYVTDDATGRVVVVALAQRRIVAHVDVGVGAHHLAFSADERRVWVALGERAESVAILDTSRPNRPRLLRHFTPGFSVHDVTFSPEENRVWLTSDTTGFVSVVNASTGRLLFRVAAGPPPQHVAFGTHGQAYVTSGYGGRLEEVDPFTGRILRTRATPYGSFNVTTAGSLVVTTSLFDGVVTEFDESLRLLSRHRVADAARGVALSVW